LNANSRVAERRRRVITRAAPVAILALLAFVIGAIAGSGGGGSDAAQRLVDAWVRGDYAAIHDELSADAKAEYSAEEIEDAYADAAETATVRSVDAGEVQDAERDGEDVEVVQMTLDTYAFGTLAGELELPVSDEGVDWAPHLVFPGLEPGETLTRRTRAPERAPILAADGRALAKGPAAARLLPLGDAAAAVVGEVAAPERAGEHELAARGFPPGSLTGTSGLELAFDERLSGVPGGQLVAVKAEQQTSLLGGRVLASSEPQPGKPVRTTIDPELQQVAVASLGSLYGGVAVLDARTGEILALAGIAFSAPQPPGSTFKMITTTAALGAGLVKLSDTFPVETSNSDIGREIANAHDEPCGGTFVEAFANSCNTVFAPLGAEVGGERLVETAERYGFNSPPPLYEQSALDAVDAPMSTLPTSLPTDLEAGVSAIGQGEVLATPLEMASVAQTIANGGTRLPTTMVKGPELRPDAEPVRVTPKETANTLRSLMIAVVQSGTGTAAALPGVQVAGKTGTAELGPKALEPRQKLRPGEEPAQELDAWFAAFAPASDPKLAVGVMVVNADGDGGTVAAPIARQVLEAGLG
jgi:Penicillin binding protein transpeptidase domain/NTF2-like N-terminal transpeptidase domain/Penicillin-binding Protein dimerisation domain